MAQRIRVFIASPNDAHEERALAVEAITDLSRRLDKLFDCTLEPVSWQDFTANPLQGPQDKPQDRFSPFVRLASVFVGIFNKRYGTPAHPPARTSGTEEEFNEALGRKDCIRILPYFRQLNERQSREPEAIKISRMRKRLRAKNVLVKDYQSPAHFKSMITLDLMDAAMSAIPEMQHKETLQQFFRLGLTVRQQDYHVKIVYPPIHKHDPTRAQKGYNWHKRLLPNVIFEDMKAVQKLEACIHRMGVREVLITTTNTPEAHEPDFNNIWLCLPRNQLAQDRLANYADVARFGLVNAGGGLAIRWNRPHARRAIHVQSPLSAYLRSRGRGASNAAWDDKYAQIPARDFAIIARYRYRGPFIGRFRPDSPAFEYFIFGIRGLGTWGAAWFIESHADELAKIVKGQKDDDVQILLEVTYRHRRIADVRDVSDEPQSYFDKQNNCSLIRKSIRVAT